MGKALSHSFSRGRNRGGVNIADLDLSQVLRFEVITAVAGQVVLSVAASVSSS
jgi:hypothetical protein